MLLEALPTNCVPYAPLPVCMLAELGGMDAVEAINSVCMYWLYPGKSVYRPP